MFKIRIDHESLDARKATHFGLAGFALGIISYFADIPYQDGEFVSLVALAATVTGTAFFVVGTYYLARSKGRSPAWAILGLLWLMGWILVAFLEDHTEVVGDRGATLV